MPAYTTPPKRSFMMLARASGGGGGRGMGDDQRRGRDKEWGGDQCVGTAYRGLISRGSRQVCCVLELIA